MIKYEIIDNYLDNSAFNQLVSDIMPNGHIAGTEENFSPNDVPWYYANDGTRKQGELEHLKKVTNIERIEPIYDLFFSHAFLRFAFQSQWFQVLVPIVAKIDPLAFFRIQGNLTLQQKEKRRCLFHIDADGNRKPKSGSMTTSIFYMNSTNGPTILEDGTEIECRANRLVTYPSETYHAGVLCTDQLYRVVININYIE